MNVQKNETTFPFPVMFLLGSRTPETGASGEGQKPQLGTLIAKQSVAFDAGGVQQPPVSSAILLTDEFYGSGQTKLEADVTVYKPRLDVLVISESEFDFVHFGEVTITRGGASGTPLDTHYDWQPRGESPRVAFAGATDPGPPGEPPVLRFTPDVNAPFKLPEAFNSEFFSGRDYVIDFGSVLAAGDQVRYDETFPATPPLDVDLTVTIPTGPTLRFTLDCWGIAPPLWVSQGVDTVVMLVDERRALLTWRFVFVWEDRLQLATLEVS